MWYWHQRQCIISEEKAGDRLARVLWCSFIFTWDETQTSELQSGEGCCVRVVLRGLWGGEGGGDGIAILRTWVWPSLPRWDIHVYTHSSPEQAADWWLTVWVWPLTKSQVSDTTTTVSTHQQSGGELAHHNPLTFQLDSLMCLQGWPR